MIINVTEHGPRLHTRKCFCENVADETKSDVNTIATSSTLIALPSYRVCFYIVPCVGGLLKQLTLAFLPPLLCPSCPPPLLSSLAVRTPLSGIHCSLWNYITCFPFNRPVQTSLSKRTGPVHSLFKRPPMLSQQRLWGWVQLKTRRAEFMFDVVIPGVYAEFGQSN